MKRSDFVKKIFEYSVNSPIDGPKTRMEIMSDFLAIVEDLLSGHELVEIKWEEENEAN